MQRRTLLGAALAGPWVAPSVAPLAAQASDAAHADTAAQALKAGGVVLAYRHATAPGSFDPPGFRLDDCSTQRNLDATGQDQARRIGAWLRQRGLAPHRVRSSPWCRCLETARLAFGETEAWPALGSPRGTDPAAYPGHLQALREAVRDAAARPGFEVWVTHMFVLTDLAGGGSASGEGLVLQAGPDGQVRVLARVPPV